MIEDNEKRVRAFYEATVPGHRESLRGLQSPHVVYDMPEGMPIGCGHFEGLQDVLERFLTSFYKALDVHFVAEEFIAGGEECRRPRSYPGKNPKRRRARRSAFCPCLDSPRRISPTNARFHRHRSASSCVGAGMRYFSEA